MLTLRSSASPFDLIERIEQQLSQQLHTAERVPAAEVHDSAEAYTLVLELPGVDRAAIEVKATDRTLVVSAERRRPQAVTPEAAAAAPSTVHTASAPQQAPAAAQPAPLLSEFRYGTWSRSFRFPTPIEREQLQAHYRDGLLTITAPKASTVSSVTVQVDG